MTNNFKPIPKDLSNYVDCTMADVIKLYREYITPQTRSEEYGQILGLARHITNQSINSKSIRDSNCDAFALHKYIEDPDNMFLREKHPELYYTFLGYANLLSEHVRGSTQPPFQQAVLRNDLEKSIHLFSLFANKNEDLSMGEVYKNFQIEFGYDKSKTHSLIQELFNASLIIPYKDGDKIYVTPDQTSIDQIMETPLVRLAQELSKQ